MTGVVFLVLLFAGVPISLVLCLSAVWYIQASGNEVLYSSFAQQLFAGVESYGLLAIPLFMLTGELMNEGGLTQRLIQAARVFVGGFRGGLAYINLLANMFMAAIIGSAASQIAVMSRAMAGARNSNIPAPPIRIIQLLISWDWATWPSSRAFASFRSVGSSVFCESSSSAI